MAGEKFLLRIEGAARAKINHFGDINKMVGDIMIGDFAGCFSFGNNRIEITKKQNPQPG